jgi:hypothetical protein
VVALVWRQVPRLDLGCGAFWFQHAGQALDGIEGDRNVLMACAKTSVLRQLAARYKRIRRVFQVTTAPSFSSLIRRVSTCALANMVKVNSLDVWSNQG